MATAASVFSVFLDVLHLSHTGINIINIIYYDVMPNNGLGSLLKGHLKEGFIVRCP